MGVPGLIIFLTLHQKKKGKHYSKPSMNRWLAYKLTRCNMWATLASNQGPICFPPTAMGNFTFCHSAAMWSCQGARLLQHLKMHSNDDSVSLDQPANRFLTWRLIICCVPEKKDFFMRYEYSQMFFFFFFKFRVKPLSKWEASAMVRLKSCGSVYECVCGVFVSVFVLCKRWL